MWRSWLSQFGMQDLDVFTFAVIIPRIHTLSLLVCCHDLPECLFRCPQIVGRMPSVNSLRKSLIQNIKQTQEKSKDIWNQPFVLKYRVNTIFLHDVLMVRHVIKLLASWRAVKPMEVSFEYYHREIRLKFGKKSL